METIRNLVSGKEEAKRNIELEKFKQDIKLENNKKLERQKQSDEFLDRAKQDRAKQGKKSSNNFKIQQIDLGKEQPKNENLTRSYKRWSINDDKLLSNMFAENKSLHHMAMMLKRTEGATSSRIILKELFVKIMRPNPITPNHIQFLQTLGCCEIIDDDDEKAINLIKKIRIENIGIELAERGYDGHIPNNLDDAKELLLKYTPLQDTQIFELKKLNCKKPYPDNQFEASKLIQSKKPPSETQKKYLIH